MSDLKDLIDQWDNQTLAARAYPETFIAGFLEAARQVANPNIEAAAKALVESDTDEKWLPYFRDKAKACVNAALGTDDG